VCSEARHPAVMPLSAKTLEMLAKVRGDEPPARTGVLNSRRKIHFGHWSNWTKWRIFAALFC